MMAQYAVGCLLVLLGMLVAMGLIRLAANLVLFLVALAGCGFVVYNIAAYEWVGWLPICGQSLLTGAALALLCLPILPLTSFYRRKK